MSKYKCIYNLNRECIAVPHGLSCSEICYKAYQQGRADKEKELAELPNEYSDKLYKIAFNKGFQKGVEDTPMRIDTLRAEEREKVVDFIIANVGFDCDNCSLIGNCGCDCKEALMKELKEKSDD